MAATIHRQGRLGAVAAAVVVLVPGAARAAHPMVTDDAGTLGRGGRQLEVGAALSRDLDGPAGAHTSDDTGEGAVGLGLGVRDDLDLVVGIASVWSRVQEDGAAVADTRGVGDATLDLKWRVLEAGGFALALKPGVSFPTGSATRGLGTGRVCYAATVVASQELGRVGLHANAGYHRDEYARREDRQASRADRFAASLAATVQVAEPVLLVADVGAETNADRASSTWPAYGLGGVVYTAHEDLDLDLGVKVGLSGPETDVTGLAGATWRF